MFETAKEARDTNVTILVNEMAAGKSGSIIVDDGGVLSYVYYTPVVATDWYMAVICPYDQVFGKLSKFNMYLLIGFVLLLLFVYFICFGCTTNHKTTDDICCFCPRCGPRKL